MLNKIKSSILDHIPDAQVSVVDETFMHHGGQVVDSITHLKIVVVSDHFHGMSRLARHRLIQEDILRDILIKVQAFHLQLMTQKEYKNSPIVRSPTCVGSH